MTCLFPKGRLAALALVLGLPVCSYSQTHALLQETVVTATRVARPLADLLADVSVIDRDAIERSGATGVTDVLARLPGVEMSRNGGPGNSGSLYVRGAESRFTAVYIDGVRVESQSTGGAVWEQIPLSQIERIEVLRGPAAAVYGSDAIGGVIQLFTKRGEGAPAPSLQLGVGSQGTRTAQAAISGGAGVLDYSLGLSHERSHGFNARPIASANPDDDGYRRTSGNARLGLQIDERQRLEGTLLASNLNSQYDSGSQDDRNHHQLRTGGLAWLGRWSDAYSTRVQISESRSDYRTTPAFYATETTLRNYLLHNEWQVGSHLLTAAVERREDALHNPSAVPAPTDLRRDRSQDALALGYGWLAGPHAVQANWRHDDDSEFGGQNTGSLSYGYAIGPEWRATVAGGTSFRAPTLYQRFSEYGVASLQPETGRNVEAALRWTRGASSAGVTVYRNRVRDLINFAGAGGCGSTFGCYANVGRAEYRGVTLSAQHRMAGVTLRGSLDWQDPHDRDSGLMLARRARRHASLGADTVVAGWTVGAEVQASGRRYDNAANTQVLGGYGLVNLTASTRIARDLTVTARLDNLADKAYQTARNYATQGRAFQVALKWAPQ